MGRRALILCLLLLGTAWAHEGHDHHAEESSESEESSEESSTEVTPTYHAPDPSLLKFLANAPHTDVVLSKGGKEMVSLAWLVRGGNITFVVQSLDNSKPNGAVGFGFGTKMQNLCAYIAWMDGDGKGHVRNYHISGVKADTVKPTNEPLYDVQVIKKDKLLGFTFTRALNGTGKGDMRSTTLNTTGAPLVPVMWALFPSWSVKDPAKDSPAPKDVHWEHATKVKEIDLSSGDEQEEAMADDAGFTKKHVAHGVLMGLSWGVLYPCSAMCVRYLRSYGGPLFFKLHLALNFVAFIFVLAAFGVIYQYQEDEDEDHFVSQHAKMGCSLFVLMFFQPLNGFLRPHPPKAGGEPTTARRLWELLHRWFGRALLLWGVFIVLTGINYAEDMEADGAAGWKGVYILWVVMGLGCGTAYLEYRRRLQQAAGGAKGGEGSKSLSELVDMELQGLDSSKA